MKARLTLAIAMSMLMASTTTAQIPNGGFESWDDHGTYMEPAGGWLTYNDIYTVSGPWITVERGTPGAAGNYYANVTSMLFPDTAVSTSVLQGWLSLNGFSYTGRPAMLSGQWQYGIQPTDTAEVLLILARWNSSGDAELVADGSLEVTGSLAGWHSLSVPLTYYSAEAPDSAYVQFSASKDFADPVAGSFLKIDDLAFTGSVGVEDHQSINAVNVFPSPAADRLNVVAGQQIADVEVLDMTGRTVLEQGVHAEQVVLDVADLKPGRYMVRMRMADGGREVRSFVKR